MDEKYCIKRTNMNKKGHFAYNLGIWLGLLSARPPVRARDPTPLPLGIASTDTIPFIYAQHKNSREFQYPRLL